MISMKKIAEELGVSRTTVSFVLNGRQDVMRISPELSEKIRTAAARLGYVRNELANSIVNGRSRSVALVALLEDFVMPNVDGFCAAAAKYGYSVRIISAAARNINDTLMSALSYRVEGIYAVNIPRENWKLIRPDFYRYRIPVIGLDDASNEAIFDFVRSAEAAVDYLLDRGHRKIVCFTDKSGDVRRLEEGYRNVMLRNHLKPKYFRFKSDYRTGKMGEYDELLDAKPEAVFCVSNFFAYDLLRFLYSREFFVPKTFSVISFGRSGISCASPPLTSVDDMRYECGWRAFEDIYREIEPESLPGHTPKPFIGKLFIRKSVADRSASA
ncbi:MAG: Ribose operon repressor [Lentisphaerae bacterium ADurb.Bin242]|nr:MAG: Ribose operon repressor [Lentisphaerae bacterium ADurb.Bin242]